MELRGDGETKPEERADRITKLHAVKPRIRGIETLFLVACLCMHAPSVAEERVALVIGNSEYKYVAPLKNPENDAKAIADILRRLDFHVIYKSNLGSTDVRITLKEFSESMVGADVALFFYAGHGLQVGNRNYLAVVDAKLRDESDLLFETIRLEDVLEVMEARVPTNLIFLDACRDNPLARSLARNIGSRSSSVGRGLADVRAGTGTLIAYATAPGEVAIDGKGENSPFTLGLREHMTTPNLDIAQMLRRVRKSVTDATGGRQVPWSSESLTTDFYFQRTKAASSESNYTESTNDADAEIIFWESISDSDRCSDFDAYLKEYPQGRFVSLAKVRSKVYCAAVNSEQSKTLEVLLDECVRHFRAKRLTTGKGGTALECYREVLDLDPANQLALEGIAAIEDTYIEWTRQAIRAQDVQRARSGLDKLRYVDQDNRLIPQLEETIAELTKNSEQEDENTSESFDRSTWTGRYIDERGCLREQDGDIVPGFSTNC